MDSQTIVAAPLEECRLQLASLREVGLRICAVLREMSREMLESSQLPSADSLQELTRFQSEFTQLQSRILPPDTAERDLVTAGSLMELQAELESQAIIQSALRRLNEIDQVQHTEQPEFAPWQRCLDDGMNVRAELSSSSTTQAKAVAEQFLSLRSPLNAALTLVTGGHELTDDRWSMLLDSVSAAYGREISTAIARGKLILKTDVRA
ncbi:MAG: hypothetical protein JSS49_05675 [Planctomycetes bacterium]|nr:hypothetical protein [Planctomycetota bacterium]